ncbi:MAG: hypothetical protein ACJ786_11905 [Catenulispora sp.]
MAFSTAGAEEGVETDEDPAVPLIEDEAPVAGLDDGVDAPPLAPAPAPPTPLTVAPLAVVVAPL